MSELDSADSPELAPERTRRTLLEAVGGFVLVVSGLFLRAEPEADAAHPGNRVQHRAGKHRQRHHRHSKQHRRGQRHDPGDGTGNGPSGVFRKGIAMLVHNNLAQEIHAELGVLKDGFYCSKMVPFDMPATTGQAFYSDGDPDGYTWLEDHWFFGFSNPFSGPPYVWVGANGDYRSRCHSGGTRILLDTALETHQQVTVKDANRKFVITRHPDRDGNKLFTIEIFPN